MYCSTFLLGLLSIALWIWNFTANPHAWASFLGMLAVLIGWALWFQPLRQVPPR